MNKKIKQPAIKDLADIREFRKKLLQWFKKNKRYYPWRETSDRYKVLIAELMLRRTKADQVLEIYNNFIDKYPDIKALRKARARDIKKITYSLGLHWRRDVFLKIAREVDCYYGGKIPDKREALKKLTGVGDYVAGAVTSLASNEKEWIVDSNIVRVFKRYFGIKTAKEGRRDKYIIAISRLYVDCKNPKSANLSLIDLAALVCTPQKPLHENCPLQRKCYYYLKL